MGRKNWLSSSTFDGAQANAVALSLIYTAKLNHLDPEEYLRKVLTEITSIEIFDSERFRKFLPWNIPSVEHYLKIKRCIHDNPR